MSESLPRPQQASERGLQRERTTLAWERTAIASMAAGILMARQAAVAFHPVWALVGMAQVLLGGAIFVWAGSATRDVRTRCAPAPSKVHPLAARVFGVGTTGFAAFAVVLAAMELAR